MRSMAGAGAPTGPLDANELEEVPSGKGYESLDEDDAPPRGNQLLEDEELVGLEEYAPEQEPSVDAGEVQAAAPIQPLQVKFALPPGAQPGAKLSIKVPDGRMLAFTVPVNAQPGMEFKLQYQPLLAPPATAALYNFIKEIDPSWMTKRFVESTLPTLVELGEFLSENLGLQVEPGLRRRQVGSAWATNIVNALQTFFKARDASAPPKPCSWCKSYCITACEACGLFNLLCHGLVNGIDQPSSQNLPSWRRVPVAAPLDCSDHLPVQ
mmetsp:Transcript_17961/g.27036  ORF Transcript_17961/g.27036 Transcript_17961/m.27036 type:complete len:267 (+) Transcript_17961:224-1024(+)